MADKKDKMEEDKEPEDIRSPKVLLKYQAAGNVANDALKHVISTIKPGGKIVDACIAGDKFIRDKTSRIYNKEKTEKGIAFPTAVSVNHVVGHFSPAADNKTTFSKGDLVKVDLGVHVDGYIAVAAHSFIVEGSPTGRAADVLACANHAAEAVLKLVKPGNKNSQITETINKMAAEFKVNAVQGVLSHQMKRFVIDGEKVIINKSDTEQKVDEFEFALNEVYAIDIVLSTGAGKPNEVDERATIYKKAPDTRYNLKRTVSRQVFGEIQKKFPVFPFNLRDLESKGVAFGVKEAAEHDLVIPYPVLFEKAGDLVAHLKFTVLIGSSGTSKISGLPFDKSIKTSVVIKDGGAGASGGGGAAKKKKKKPKKKKPAAGGAGGAGGAAAKEEEEEEEEEGEEPMDTS